MATEPVTLPVSPAAEVHLEDTSGAEPVTYVYRLRKLVRSLRVELEDIQDRVDAFDRIADEARLELLQETDEEKRRALKERIRENETAGLRGMCDAINATLSKTSETTPSPGDLLFEGWEQDRIDEDEIVGLAERLREARRPT